MNQCMNDGGVCRTAPATPGLLKSKSVSVKPKYVFTVFVHRPGLAGSVLQTPSLLTDWLTN